MDKLTSYLAIIYFQAEYTSLIFMQYWEVCEGDPDKYLRDRASLKFNDIALLFSLLHIFGHNIASGHLSDNLYYVVVRFPHLLGLKLPIFPLALLCAIGGRVRIIIIIAYRKIGVIITRLRLRLRLLTKR